MNIRFLEPARSELDDAFDWYEMEQSGLGRRFLAEIQSALERITVFPDSCAVILKTAVETQRHLDTEEIIEII